MRARLQTLTLNLTLALTLTLTLPLRVSLRAALLFVVIRHDAAFFRPNQAFGLG